MGWLRQMLNTGHKTAGAWELSEAQKCMRAAEEAKAEGDDTHASELANRAQAWESAAIQSVRRDRESRHGLYQNTSAW